ncbi:putative Root UVB sensitive family [Helianthus debilis subsp. tardiflorus]
MKLDRRTSTATSQTLTATTSSADARLLVRETLRISANLASSPSSVLPPSETVRSPDAASFGLIEEQFVDASLRLICYEEIDGRRFKYLAQKEGSKLRKGSNSIRAVSLQSRRAPVDELVSFIRSYVVPDGFPDSVSPSYVPYMTWRALKHFFGGAMGVFTTQALLHSVGVSKSQAMPGAVAINWIIKDGSGRIGKMLFSRQGKKFDYDLKQLRLSGDLLMELGAAVELATTAVPHLFLPLACAANVAKNVAAVTSTSTRTPIYKAFAKGENIGDVTAKGECVGNVADLLGTGFSIIMAKRNPSLFTTFALLSCGYLFSSYREVKSVVLHTLNRARFTVAVESFLKTGSVPTLQEGNMMETVFNLPWCKDGPVVLGSRFKDAFQDANSFYDVEPVFEKERYVVAYNPLKGNIYAVLKDKAKSDDILKAAFHAHVLLYVLRSSKHIQVTNEYTSGDRVNPLPTSADLQAHVAESYNMVSALYEPFKNKTKEQGWVMSDSLLNPGRARICEQVR